LKLTVICLFAFIPSCLSKADAAVIFGNNGLNNGSRWDAAPRTIGGNERSLMGGLRYSLQGGSYEDYRDLFSWQGTAPSIAEFQQAIEESFAAWTVLDPASGLETDLTFVADLSTPVAGPAANIGVNVNGAEIDLLAETDGVLWNSGDSSLRAETFFNTSSFTNLTLTSGTTSYPGFAISGADLKMNNNSGALWNLTRFQSIMTHEIGHAIGLGDVDVSGTFGDFIDDNYDGSSSTTALATLTNSWAGLVNPINPANSPLGLFNVANANPGVDTPGVDILMETIVPAVFNGDPTPLQNDDFGGRQFLYPALGAGPPAVPTGPIVQYRFPESWDGLAGVVADLSGEENDGTPAGAPLLTAAVPPGADVGLMSLDTHNGGIQTEATRLLTNFEIGSAGGFRYEVDVFWDGTTNGFDIQKVIDYAGTEFLQLENSDLLAGTSELRFGFNDTEGLGPVVTLTANEWHHVEAAFDTEGNLVDGNGDLAGTATLTVDETSVAESVFKSDFGDGLTRSIGIGMFANFSGLVDFHGFIHNPVVSFGIPVDGDFDEDGDVDGIDFLVLQQGLGTIYDATDLDDWELNYGAGTLAVASIPEPTTYALALAALCLAISRRRAF